MSSRQGEIAELKFEVKALELGFTVLHPYGMDYKYDLVTELNGDFKKIQVKSTAFVPKGKRSIYRCNTSYKKGTGVYTKDHFDFMAVYIFPEDIFYIIPVESLTKVKIILNPRNPDSKGKYESYKEAWQLLKE